jgi:hypothetical protein
MLSAEHDQIGSTKEAYVASEADGIEGAQTAGIQAGKAAFPFKGQPRGLRLRNSKKTRGRGRVEVNWPR